MKSMVVGGVLLGFALACGGLDLDGNEVALGGSAEGRLGPTNPTHPIRDAPMSTYRLSVPRDQLVQIDLVGNDFDAYLYVMDGTGTTELYYNDDFHLTTDSRVVAWLPAGTYQLIATAFAQPEPGTGSYVLSTKGIEQATHGSLTLGQEVQGALTAGSMYSPWRVAYFQAYEMVVPDHREVTIDLKSSDFDAYLYLLDERFQYVESNDDHEGTDSRITRTLDPGTYVLVATSFDESETGSFTLSAR